jgi:hypothetical protein
MFSIGYDLYCISSHRPSCYPMMLTRKQPYQDLGAAYFDQREQERVERRLVHRLERLGYEVSLQPRALAS